MWLQGGPYHRAVVASQLKWASVYQPASKAFPYPQLPAKQKQRVHMDSPGTQPHKILFSFSRAVRGDAKANPGNQMCVVAMQRPENRTHRGPMQQA